MTLPDLTLLTSLSACAYNSTSSTHTDIIVYNIRRISGQVEDTKGPKTTQRSANYYRMTHTTSIQAFFTNHQTTNTIEPSESRTNINIRAETHPEIYPDNNDMHPGTHPEAHHDTHDDSHSGGIKHAVASVFRSPAVKKHDKVLAESADHMAAEGDHPGLISDPTAVDMSDHDKAKLLVEERNANAPTGNFVLGDHKPGMVSQGYGEYYGSKAATQNRT